MRHTLKQLKYIAGGGAVVYWLGIREHILQLLGTPGWPSLVAGGCVGIGSVTVLIFLYLIVVLPRLKGIHPDYKNWRATPEISTLVPILTITIASGWLFLLASLARWTRLNLLESLAGSTGSYALMFGLLGLIPVPKSSRSGTSF